MNGNFVTDPEQDSSAEDFEEDDAGDADGAEESGTGDGGPAQDQEDTE